MMFALVLILDAVHPNFQPEGVYIGALAIDFFIILPIVLSFLGV